MLKENQQRQIPNMLIETVTMQYVAVRLKQYTGPVNAPIIRHAQIS